MKRYVVRTLVLVAGLVFQELGRRRGPLICCIPYGPCRCGRG